MDRFDRYLRIANWLRARYTRAGELVISIGGKPTRYSRLELMAYRRYVVESEA